MNVLPINLGEEKQEMMFQKFFLDIKNINYIMN